MSPNDCPKFTRCAAPVCPLYANWRSTRQLPGERTCLYLREAAKAGGEALVRGTLPGELAEAVLVAYQDIVTSQRIPPDQGFGYLRRVLLRSAQYGSKLQGGERLMATAAQQ